MYARFVVVNRNSPYRAFRIIDHTRGLIRMNKTFEVTGYLMDELSYCVHCADETQVKKAFKILEHQQWEEQPTCYKCGDSIAVQVMKKKFEVHHLDTNEIRSFFNECAVEEYLMELSWKVNDWTPMFQEYVTEDGEFTMFVHSESWDEEVDEDGDCFYSEEGEKAWEEKGYDLNDDYGFWDLFQKEFKIKVVPIVEKHGLFFGYDMPMALDLKHKFITPLLDKLFIRAEMDGDLVHVLTSRELEENQHAILNLTSSINDLFDVALSPEFVLIDSQVISNVVDERDGE